MWLYALYSGVLYSKLNRYMVLAVYTPIIDPALSRPACQLYSSIQRVQRIYNVYSYNSYTHSIQRLLNTLPQLSTSLHRKHCMRHIGAGERSVWAAELELRCPHALLVDADSGLEHTLHIACDRVCIPYARCS